MYYEGRTHEFYDILDSMFLILLMAWLSGTNVNNAVTSQDGMHSPGCILMTSNQPYSSEQLNGLLQGKSC